MCLIKLITVVTVKPDPGQLAAHHQRTNPTLNHLKSMQSHFFFFEKKKSNQTVKKSANDWQIHPTKKKKK